MVRFLVAEESDVFWCTADEVCFSELVSGLMFDAGSSVPAEFFGPKLWLIVWPDI